MVTGYEREYYYSIKVIAKELGEIKDTLKEILAERKDSPLIKEMKEQGWKFEAVTNETKS